MAWCLPENGLVKLTRASFFQHNTPLMLSGLEGARRVVGGVWVGHWPLDKFHGGTDQYYDRLGAFLLVQVSIRGGSCIAFY